MPKFFLSVVIIIVKADTSAHGISRIRKCRTYLYSNINCVAENKVMKAWIEKAMPKRIYLYQQRPPTERSLIGKRAVPFHVPKTSFRKVSVCSVPSTKPIVFAVIIMRMLKTAAAAQTWRYHGLLPYYRHDLVSVRKFVVCTQIWLTFLSGRTREAIISGSTKSVITHPHVKRRNDRSCQSATKVNDTSVATIVLELFASGTYR